MSMELTKRPEQEFRGQGGGALAHTYARMDMSMLRGMYY
jgi:hypothetical protein